jgi:hypothetical protein
MAYTRPKQSATSSSPVEPNRTSKSYINPYTHRKLPVPNMAKPSVGSPLVAVKQLMFDLGKVRRLEFTKTHRVMRRLTCMALDELLEERVMQKMTDKEGTYYAVKMGAKRPC